MMVDLMERRKLSSGYALTHSQASKLTHKTVREKERKRMSFPQVIITLQNLFISSTILLQYMAEALYTL